MNISIDINMCEMWNYPKHEDSQNFMFLMKHGPENLVLDLDKGFHKDFLKNMGREFLKIDFWILGLNEKVTS